MGRTLSLTAVFVLLSVTAAFAQNSTIGVYTDASGSTCSFSGNDPGPVTAYVIVRPGPEGFRAIRFSAPLPSCFGGSFIEDVVPTELPYIGDSQTGISIASGTCQEHPLLVLSINYTRTSSSTPCCPYPVLPEAGFDHIEVITCASFESSYAGRVAHFNADETCACTAGQAPDVASHPDPIDGATGVTVWTGLSWIGSDYDGDLADFDLYLGTSADPPLVAAHVNAMSYQPDAPLDENTHYYWRVVTRDAHHNETSGPTWDFTTRPLNSPPGAPVPGYPTDGALTERSLMLEWSSYDIDHDRLSYDVYLGTGDSPPLVSKGQFEMRRYTYTLLPSTEYSWKIVVHDPAGNVTEGSLWHFRTKQASGLAVPSEPSPANGAVVSTTGVLSWKGNAPTYRVYMGPFDAAPQQVASDLTSPSFDPPGNLLPDTHYVWFVIAYSNAGQETGPVWNFYTGSPPDNMPEAPASLLVGPSNDAASLTWSVANPSGQPLTYDVYLGRNENPSFVGTTTETSFTTGTLIAGARYYWRVDAWDGNVRASGTNWSFQVPAVGLGIAPNQPNPFNPETTIPYSVPWSADVKLTIYDAAGRLVRKLVDEHQNAGSRSVVWRGNDQAGQPVASGVYFCVLQAAEERRTLKLVLLK
jgi:hypothetical protein